MKVLTLRDDNGDFRLVEITPEALADNPNLGAAIERIETSRANLSQYGNQYEKNPGHDRMHEKVPGHGRYHSRNP